jgi:hypothetical protein
LKTFISEDSIIELEIISIDLFQAVRELPLKSWNVFPRITIILFSSFRFAIFFFEFFFSRFSGKTIPCTNLGSYNYLGFADPDSPCVPEVLKTCDAFPVSTCSPRTDVGTTSLHVETEQLVARYVGKEAAMIFGMGFGTNSTGIPTLIGKGGLIISDSLNHASIVIGARSSGAKIQVFKHGGSFCVYFQCILQFSIRYE